jgi:hypothetical protein
MWEDYVDQRRKGLLCWRTQYGEDYVEARRKGSVALEDTM